MESPYPGHNNLKRKNSFVKFIDSSFIMCGTTCPAAAKPILWHKSLETKTYTRSRANLPTPNRRSMQTNAKSWCNRTTRRKKPINVARVNLSVCDTLGEIPSSHMLDSVIRGTRMQYTNVRGVLAWMTRHCRGATRATYTHVSAYIFALYTFLRGLRTHSVRRYILTAQLLRISRCIIIARSVYYSLWALFLKGY